jgi:nucleoid DNA-binding protein
MMSDSPIPTTTNQAVRTISEELGLEESVVAKVIDAFVDKVRMAFREELPFMVRGLGKFYFRYAARPKAFIKEESKDYYKNKVVREIVFSPNDDIKAEFLGWVHDFGAKDNMSQSLLELKIQPVEFSKMIKKKILEEQRQMGFRPELLFDELPESERSLVKEIGEAPTVEQIMNRIGLCLDDS